MKEFKSVGMNWKQQARSYVVANAPAVEEDKDANAADALRSLVESGKLFGGDVEFARSLLSGFAKYQSFTPKQRPYVEKLIAKGLAPKAPLVSRVYDLDLSKVPAGRYAVEQRRIEISKPVDGKWAGWVFVKDGSEYGAGRRIAGGRPEWKGCVEIKGSAQMLADRRDLESIIADPLEASKQYGRITSTCGVCGRTLENPESVAYGVGPHCRARFSV